jgi:hypothetical protein
MDVAIPDWPVTLNYRMFELCLTALDLRRSRLMKLQSNLY